MIPPLARIRTIRPYAIAASKSSATKKKAAGTFGLPAAFFVLRGAGLERGLDRLEENEYYIRNGGIVLMMHEKTEKG